MTSERIFDAHRPAQIHRRLKKLVAISEKTNTPLLAVNDVLYHAPERRGLQDVMTCVREHMTIDDAGTLVLLWQTQFNVNTMLFVRTLQGNTWGDPIQVYGNMFSLKRAPQIAVTRDTISVSDGQGGSTLVSRAVLHLVWWEESEKPGGHVLYQPLVLINGDYQEQSQTPYVLNDLDQTADTSDAQVTQALYESPRILSGRSDQSVVIAFANSENGHVTTVESSVLPGDVGELIDAVRAHIITGGLKGDLTFIGDAVRAHIITGGRGGRLNSHVLGFLGDAVRAHIITGGIPASNLTALGNDARSFLLQSSAALADSGLVGPEVLNSTFIEQPAEPGLASQFVQLHAVSTRPAPLTGPGANSLVLSEDATRVLAAWETAAGDIRYRESTATGWTAPITLTLKGSLTRDAAYKLLDQRLRGH